MLQSQRDSAGSVPPAGRTLSAGMQGQLQGCTRGWRVGSGADLKYQHQVRGAPKLASGVWS